MIAFEKKKENVSAKQKTGRKPKLSERDRWTLRQIVRKDCRTITLRITSELIEHLRTICLQELSVESCTRKYSIEKLKFENLCFHRQMF